MQGCHYEGKTRNHTTLKRSGGIGIFIKDYLFKAAEIIEWACNDIIWVYNINYSVLDGLNEDILIGDIYLPPVGYRYFDESEFSFLEQGHTVKSSEYKMTCLIGDINARTSELPDYSKTPLLGPPLGLRKNGLYSGVVLLLS